MSVVKTDEVIEGSGNFYHPLGQNNSHFNQFILTFGFWYNSCFFWTSSAPILTAINLIQDASDRLWLSGFPSNPGIKLISEHTIQHDCASFFVKP